MDKKRTLTLVIALITLVLVLGGGTYAFFTANTSGNETGSTLTVQGGTLEIEYANQSSIITLDNIYPRETEWVTKNFTVTGTNTIDTTMNYRVGIEVLSSGFADGDLTYTLTNTDQVTPTGSPIDDASGDILASGTTWIDYGQFAASSRNVVHTYQLKIYYLSTNESQNNRQGATFRAKVVLVEAGIGNIQNSNNSSSQTNNNNAPTGTLLRTAVMNNPLNASSPTLTTPGVDPALDDEGLRSTVDDYGTSYYYRGAIDYNYVVFANMCWRIVRIDGAGNTKLVLYNAINIGTPTADMVSNPCNPQYDSPNLGHLKYYAEEYGEYLKSADFNDPPNRTMYTLDYDNTYVGFMYSNNPNSSDFNVAHANDNDSIILSKLKTWYNDVFTSTQKQQLADVIWCNDKRVVSDLTYNPDSYSGEIKGTGLDRDNTYYQPVMRLLSANHTPGGTGPTLKCGETINDNKISKYTASDTTYGNGALNGYKIGLLTADEVAFAGSVFAGLNYSTNGDANNSFYLRDNADGWWTLSPHSHHEGTGTTVIMVSDGLLKIGYVNNSWGIRPAISLNSTVTTSSGDGTSLDPFIID